jgi:hypothetical protein
MLLEGIGPDACAERPNEAHRACELAEVVLVFVLERVSASTRVKLALIHLRPEVGQEVTVLALLAHPGLQVPDPGGMLATTHGEVDLVRTLCQLRPTFEYGQMCWR